MKRLVLLTIAALCVMTGLLGATNPGLAAAACGQGDTSSKGQLLQGAGQTGSDCKGVAVTSVAATAVKLLSIVTGIVAVIMIIVGGFKYITSGGESGKTSGAKSTLIYAMIGLLVAALAQFIVHFVLSNAKP